MHRHAAPGSRAAWVLARFRGLPYRPRHGLGGIIAMPVAEPTIVT
ncbi:MAG: hypothetical protein ABIR59_13175 [Gemmatimonadales bacterium]